MISIVDYGVGNLFSLKCSLDVIGEDIIITDDIDAIKKSDKIILPGVGAFQDARKKLSDTGLDKVIIDEAKNSKPLLGICLGMQLLFDKSYEYGEYAGLGLVNGNVISLENAVGDSLKIPHMGWNKLILNKENSKIFKYINNGDYVYFVHSYYAAGCDDDVSAYTEYGIKITASVENKNVYGCQFHPEKSGKVGLKILKAFCDM